MTFCTQCGRPVEPGTQFCTHCGASQAPGTAVAPQPPAPVLAHGGLPLLPVLLGSLVETNDTLEGRARNRRVELTRE